MRDFLRLVLMLVALMGSFTQFVACGADLYQISLDGDSPQLNLKPGKNPGDPSYGIHAYDGWQTLPIQFKTAIDIDAQQLEAIQNAMRTWEWALGTAYGTIFSFLGQHEGTVGDSFRDLNSSLKDYINGHYFDQNWAKTGKKTEVIATTIWENAAGSHSLITTADIRYNTQVYILGDSFKLKSTPQRQVVDLESLALHEIGHLLGLEHIDQKVDGYSIMNPRLFVGEGLAARSLSRGDILRIQSIYGCHGLACDVDALLNSSLEARAPSAAAPVTAQIKSTSDSSTVETRRY